MTDPIPGLCFPSSLTECYALLFIKPFLEFNSRTGDPTNLFKSGSSAWIAE